MYSPIGMAPLRELAAARVLGVKEVVFLGYPNQGLEEGGQFRKDIVRLIRQFRPDTVVTVDPYRGCLDRRDHRITARAGIMSWPKGFTGKKRGGRGYLFFFDAGSRRA